MGGVGVPGPGDVPGPRGVYLVPKGVYLVWGVYLAQGECTWSWGVYLVLGGVPGPGGVAGPGGCLVRYPPCGQTHACKNITVATLLRTVNM